MSERFTQHSAAWVNFTYASFISACLLVGAGIFFLPLDVWIRAYLVMGVVMIIQTAISLTKTLRDIEETDKLIARIEDARTEKLLMDVNQSEHAA